MFLKNFLYLCVFVVIFGINKIQSKIVHLDSGNFNEKVIKSDSIWIVGFYDQQSNAHKKFQPAFEFLANVLKGIVKIGAIEASNKDIFKEYKVKNVKDIPVVRIFKDKSSYEYKEEATKEKILEHIITVIENVIRKRGNLKSKPKSSDNKQSSKVIELTDGNFKSKVLDSNELWLVEFYAPWCGHCKNLKPHWEEAAKRLEGKINMGALDATVHTKMTQEYEIRGFPTIKLFRNGQTEEYTGGRTADDIENWVLNIVGSKPVELLQLTDNDTFEKHCRNYKLCIVSFLPHILDCQSECRNVYLNLLKKMAEKHNSWGWVWTEAVSQPNLESALNVGGFGYPALVTINFDKDKYVVFKGSFSEHGLNEFFNEILSGRVRTEELIRTIQITNVPEWDGKDAELPNEDEGYEEL